MQPDLLTYGQATVNGIDLSKDQAGEVTSLSHVTQMDFAAPLKARMSAPGTNMLVFIHGFDNSFSDAVTRAAFKQGVAGRIRTTWHGQPPSLRSVGRPWARSWGASAGSDYKADRAPHRIGRGHRSPSSRGSTRSSARSGAAAAGSTSLAHSMGNLALEVGGRETKCP